MLQWHGWGVLAWARLQASVALWLPSMPLMCQQYHRLLLWAEGGRGRGTCLCLLPALFLVEPCTRYSLPGHACKYSSHHCHVDDMQCKYSPCYA